MVACGFVFLQVLLATDDIAKRIEVIDAPAEGRPDGSGSPDCDYQHFVAFILVDTEDERPFEEPATS